MKFEYFHKATSTWKQHQNDKCFQNLTGVGITHISAVKKYIISRTGNQKIMSNFTMLIEIIFCQDYPLLVILLKQQHFFPSGSSRHIRRTENSSCISSPANWTKTWMFWVYRGKKGPDTWYGETATETVLQLKMHRKGKGKGKKSQSYKLRCSQFHC